MIALHSPDRFAETGLCVCRPEKSARKPGCGFDEIPSPDLELRTKRPGNSATQKQTKEFTNFSAYGKVHGSGWHRPGSVEKRFDQKIWRSGRTLHQDYGSHAGKRLNTKNCVIGTIALARHKIHPDFGTSRAICRFVFPLFDRYHGRIHQHRVAPDDGDFTYGAVRTD